MELLTAFGKDAITSVWTRIILAHILRSPGLCFTQSGGSERLLCKANVPFASKKTQLPKIISGGSSTVKSFSRKGKTWISTWLQHLLITKTWTPCLASKSSSCRKYPDAVTGRPQWCAGGEEIDPSLPPS